MEQENLKVLQTMLWGKILSKRCSLLLIFRRRHKNWANRPNCRGPHCKRSTSNPCSCNGVLHRVWRYFFDLNIDNRLKGSWGVQNKGKWKEMVLRWQGLLQRREEGKIIRNVLVFWGLQKRWNSQACFVSKHFKKEKVLKHCQRWLWVQRKPEPQNQQGGVQVPCQHRMRTLVHLSF